MKTNKNVPTLNTLENLATTIQDTNTFFLDKLNHMFEESFDILWFTQNFE